MELPGRRIEDRIRELCARIAVAQGEEVAEMLSELQIAMHEHARRVDNETTAAVITWPVFPKERRKRA
jgi:hypothetical protein